MGTHYDRAKEQMERQFGYKLKQKKQKRRNNSEQKVALTNEKHTTVKTTEDYEQHRKVTYSILRNHAKFDISRRQQQGQEGNSERQTEKQKKEERGQGQENQRKTQHQQFIIQTNSKFEFKI